MREGDYRIDRKQVAVDFLLAQVTSSRVNNVHMGKAIRGIKRMDKEGVFDEFGDEILSLNEAFDWHNTPEGYKFWKYIYECCEAEEDVRRRADAG